MLTDKFRFRYVVLLLSAGIILLGAGILLGDNALIFRKAVFICMECIGIG
jgi:hypothetical protein